MLRSLCLCRQELLFNWIYRHKTYQSLMFYSGVMINQRILVTYISAIKEVILTLSTRTEWISINNLFSDTDEHAEDRQWTLQTKTNGIAESNIATYRVSVMGECDVN